MWKENILIRSDVLAGIPELIDHLGGDSDKLMREAGINPKDRRGGSKFICWLALNRLLTNAAKELNTPDLGLQWATRHKLAMNNFGPIVVLMMISKDVRSFIQNWIEFDRLYTMGNYSQVVEGPEHGLAPDTARVIERYSSAAPDSRQLKEAFNSIIYRLLKEHAGVPNPVKEIGFPHKPMADIEIYKSYFDCPIKFNTPYLYIDFPASLLDKKMGPTFNPGKDLFTTHVERNLRNSPIGRYSLSAQIGLILPQVLGTGNSDAETVAKTLGLSLRKMQRLLKDEGSNYSEILDQVRRSMAIEFLQNSEVSINRISKLLDYKTPVAFSNAFKRWMEMSPRNYRKAQQTGD